MTFDIDFRYLTDILNMMQGFYIFLIFVCKQNVYEALLKAIFFRNNVFRKVNMDFFANFLDCDSNKKDFVEVDPFLGKR